MCVCVCVKAVWFVRENKLRPAPVIAASAADAADTVGPAEDLVVHNESSARSGRGATVSFCMIDAEII